MRKLAIFAILLQVLPSLLLAQGNYLANTPNNSTTATYGTFNTFVGPYAGASFHSAGNRNTVVGYDAGISLTSGSFNSFFGVDAGENTTSGSYNTFVGRSAGLKNTTGYYNVFTGAFAGQANTAGYSNVFSGYQAGNVNTIGGSNLFDGYQAGYTNTTGSLNVFSGWQAGYSNTSGGTNTFSGAQAGYSNTEGNGNVFIGNLTGSSNTTGNFNTFTGTYAGTSNTTGESNVFYGYGAGASNKTGSNNIIIGPQSGTAITTSDDNVLIGYNSQADNGLYNAIAIGANSRVSISNALILGNQANVGIGTSAPTARLQVRSEQSNESGVRFEQLTSKSPSVLSTDQFLTVNEQGDVVKGRYQLRINNTSEWSDKVFAPDYNLQSLAEVKKYIDANQHLPGVPSAEQVVHDGVDLVKMNATLLEKVEELTLYSIEQDKKAQKQEERIDQLEQLLKQLLGKK
ncbi:hypothetical protein GO755_40375 [Spirosoma sp. HMF4905]|uniref:TMF family protein n=1 Tax=Spirosoma arboris TaxID=2682092 RepID=A0A7K1SRB9_9BACT|nr:hypothetical protein [Spirosoma arboris]MVM36329.1 hypothetical protein [Spirosoma arboris]